MRPRIDFCEGRQHSKFVLLDRKKFMNLAKDDPMDQPIRDFSNCHVGIVHALHGLTALSRRRDPIQQRREEAGRILKFFRDVVTEHHKEEELELFPAVLADATAGEERDKVEAIANQLTGEHRRVESRYAAIAPVLAMIESGGDASLDASAVETLVADYLAHAQFEEEVFLPLAQTILSRNGDHLAALGLSLHIRHASEEVRRRFGYI